MKDNSCLFKFDNELRNKGYENVCGIDEAGRGPLAGPVFAASVILPTNVRFDLLDDSKRVSAKNREILFHEITTKSLYYNISAASVEEIDSINILQATFLAMNRAILPIIHHCDIIIIDGNSIPPQLQNNAKCKTISIVKGDKTSACVAAASILAKVARDRFMMAIDEKYPQYIFGKHKGYGTKLHYEMLDKYGASDVHRQSFLKKYYAQKQPENI